MKTLINIRTLILFVFLSLITANIYSQEERKIIREGNKSYKNKDFDNSELNFKKAMEINPELSKLHGNISASQYRNGKFNDARTSYENVLKLSGNNKEKADAFYNIGNSYLQAAEYDKSIQAYKNAIRLNPEHDQSRYNMAVATKIQEQQQSGDNQNQDQNQDNQENQDKDQNQDNKNQDNQDKQNQDQDQDQKQEDTKQEQSRDNQMSREEMERYLEALQQQEKDVQDKVNKEKFKSQKRVIEKNW
ncbi:MAG: tetratricopeptide repeat protein [Bacteroidales bacterium]|nr:tetratricopeptide repeat protein [Bacteroidales bacterium]